MKKSKFPTKENAGCEIPPPPWEFSYQTKFFKNNLVGKFQHHPPWEFPYQISKFTKNQDFAANFEISRFGEFLEFLCKKNNFFQNLALNLDLLKLL